MDLLYMYVFLTYAGWGFDGFFVLVPSWIVIWFWLKEPRYNIQQGGGANIAVFVQWLYALLVDVYGIYFGYL